MSWPARGAALLSAVHHIDGTTRPQVLDGTRCSIAAAVLEQLEHSGRPPVLLNTSFNGHGEPIVNSQTDALEAFARMDLDFLVLPGRSLTKLRDRRDGPG